MATIRRRLLNEEQERREQRGEEIDSSALHNPLHVFSFLKYPWMTWMPRAAVPHSFTVIFEYR